MRLSWKNNYLIGENLYIYFSQPRLNSLGQRHAFIIRGYGDLIVRNCTFLTYSSNIDSMNTASRFGGAKFEINTTRTFITLFENIYMTNPDFDTTASLDQDPTNGRMTGSSYMDLNLTFSNYTIENIYSSGSIGVFQVRMKDRHNIHIKDVTIKNVIASTVLFEITGGNSQTFENIKLINCTLHASELLLLSDTFNLMLNNFVIQDIQLLGTFSNKLGTIVSVFINLLFRLIIPILQWI